MAKAPRIPGKTTFTPKNKKPLRDSVDHLTLAQSYSRGISSLVYHMEAAHKFLGADNLINLVKEIDAGNIRGVRRTMEALIEHNHGNAYAMIDWACDTDTHYGLTRATSAKNGAGF